jgi:hypothetical protein
MVRRSVSSALLVPLLIGLGLLIWFLLRPAPPEAQPPENESPVPDAQGVELEPAPVRPLSTPAEVPPPPPEPATPPPAQPASPPPAAPRADAPPAPPPDDAIHTEVESVGTMIRDFRNAVGGNPVGTNAEITKALLGDNEKQVKFDLPPGASVNGEGELVDRWGTPFFFHQLSGTQMEIRSAGPDRRLWTEDDVHGR